MSDIDLSEEALTCLKGLFETSEPSHSFSVGVQLQLINNKLAETTRRSSLKGPVEWMHITPEGRRYLLASGFDPHAREPMGFTPEG